MTSAYKKPLFLIFLFSSLLLLTYSNIVSSNASEVEPVLPVPQYKVQAEAPNLEAAAFAVFDVMTGEILVSSAKTEVLPVASVTKLITATTLLLKTDVETIGTIAEVDVAAEGRAGKLEAGDSYTYRELLFPLLLVSSNDAAAFFERETKGEVIENMNTLVQELGMVDTRFVDASGLSDLNVSSVADLITFTSYIYREEPHVLDMSRLEQYVGSYTGWVNNSPVITASYLGGKHGFTEAAGRTLVALFEEEFAGVNRALGYVVLGSENLVADTAKLRAFVAESVVFE